MTAALRSTSAHARVHTPFCTVILQVADDALVSVDWAARAERASKSSTAPAEHAHPVLRQAVDELERFAAGELQRFTVPLDLSGVGGFRRRVLELLEREVGFGSTLTYGELAALAGNPRAARAVGTAMNRNPIPIFVPCHRVLASTGIGGFGPGLDIKRKLLEHECVGAD